MVHTQVKFKQFMDMVSIYLKADSHKTNNLVFVLFLRNKTNIAVFQVHDGYVLDWRISDLIYKSFFLETKVIYIFGCSPPD
jgi:hypothetical protein